MNETEAIKILMQVANLAQKAGLLSLDDAGQVLIARKTTEALLEKLESQNAPVPSRINAATGDDTSAVGEPGPSSTE